MLTADEGFYFGIGAFETIAVEAGCPVFWKQHFERLQRAMDFLGIDTPVREISEQALEKLRKETGRMAAEESKRRNACAAAEADRERSECAENQQGSMAEAAEGSKRWSACAAAEMQPVRKVLKVAVSPENVVVTVRDNTYGPDDYARGFTVRFSDVRRNETSPFTYHKTFHYGDCLFEKRRAKAEGVDEPVFLNTRGEITEGACTNVFFVKRGRIVTPAVSSGLLAGILRGYVCGSCDVEERAVTPEEAYECDEMFLTNSLLGVMPVTRLGRYEFPSRTVGDGLLRRYRMACGSDQTVGGGIDAL